jgi:cytochrome c oxidase subunit 1
MTIASTMVQGTPLFGAMFRVDKSTGLEEINAWPALMIMASFVWLAVAGLLGLAMPATQVLDLPTDWFYTALTAHGAALAFPFTFQLMIGVGLHRSRAAASASRSPAGCRPCDLHRAEPRVPRCSPIADAARASRSAWS